MTHNALLTALACMRAYTTAFFAAAGLAVAHSEAQPGLPHGVFAVRMYVLRPVEGEDQFEVGRQLADQLRAEGLPCGLGGGLAGERASFGPVLSPSDAGSTRLQRVARQQLYAGARRHRTCEGRVFLISLKW